MNDKHWDMLFDLIERAVNLDGMSATEKGETIREKANERGALTNLEEFVSMAESE